MEFHISMFPEARFYQKKTVHAYNEVLINKKGSGFILADGHRYRFSTGHVALIPAGVEHEDIAPESRLQVIIQFTDAKLKLTGGITILPDVNRKFERLTDLILEVTPAETPGQQAYREALIEAFYYLLRTNGQHGTGFSIPIAGFVQQIAQQIQQNFSDPDFDLAGAIEQTGYSVPYFRRAFYREFGKSPREQLTQMRIAFAKTQLEQRHRTMTIKQIANVSGFSDPYYFSRVFHQQMGASPRQYLQSITCESKKEI